MERLFVRMVTKNSRGHNPQQGLSKGARRRSARRSCALRVFDGNISFSSPFNRLLELRKWKTESCPDLVCFLLALDLLEICMHKEWIHSSIKQNGNLKGSTKPLTLMFEQPPVKKTKGRKRKKKA